MKASTVFLIVFAIAMAEVALMVNQTLGFIFYSILIGGVLIALSLSDSVNEDGKLMVYFLIVPFVRITTLFIPFSFFYRTLISYYLLLFLVTFYYGKFKLEGIYSGKGIFFIIPAIFLAFILGFIGSYYISVQKVPEIIAIIPLIAYGEEVLFRGYMQKSLRKDSVFLSLLIPALLYGIFALPFGFFIALFLFAMSFVYGVFYEWSDNIYIPMAMNAIVTAIIFSII